MLGRLEPGMANRFAGLGDEASAIGPAFMVRTGEDFVNLTRGGVDDHVAVAKRIITVMRPRIGASAQAQTPAARGTGADGGSASGSNADDAARTGQVVAGLVGQLMNENRAASREAGAEGDSRANGTCRRARTRALLLVGPVDLPLVAGWTPWSLDHQ